MYASRVPGGGSSGAAVTLTDHGSHITLDNEIVQLRLSVPGGMLVGLSFGGIDNLLEIQNQEKNRGYWDLNWNLPGGQDNYDVHSGSQYRVISDDGDKVEVSFLRRYGSGKSSTIAPLDIDKRFVLLRGNTGFYTYAVYEKKEAYPAFALNQARIVFKLQSEKFQYMAVSDRIQRIMPSPEDRSPKRSQQLAYPEAVLLKDPVNPILQGEVDDKYQYTADNKDGRVHGWISMDPFVGFWVIVPSDEFRNGGPTKQNLRCHTGPTCLSMFHAAHYGGEPLCATFDEGEAWKKVFGPVFIYLNSARASLDPYYLWQDAKQQMLAEAESWPYDWPSSSEFVKSNERGTVTGKLLVQDKYFLEDLYPASFAFVGLARPGESGSWQTESKGYQFWSQANASGYFEIKNIRPATYDLYAFVPGVLGDYKKLGSTTVVHKGSSVELGDLVYVPPRKGLTLWEIGTPERTAAHFSVPEPDPKLINRIFLLDPADRYRQYGLWNKYSELYPDQDLVYTVGTSDWRKDWYFMHGCRIGTNGSLSATTWEIKFQLKTVVQDEGPYTLRIALAAANVAAIQVRVNDPDAHPLFDTSQIGRDNAIARHGIHGLYSLWSVDIQPSHLKMGDNSIFLTQRKTGIFSGVMYDYLRLEAP